jgi:hypothetical protein
MAGFSVPTCTQRYAAALKQSDLARVHEAVLAAEEALFARGRKIHGSADHGSEPWEMDSAFANSLAIKVYRPGWPQISQ